MEKEMYDRPYLYKQLCNNSFSCYARLTFKGALDKYNIIPQFFHNKHDKVVPL